MAFVTSADGTRIAYERSGDGPPVILVGAALSDRADTRKLARLLAERFTVFNYDRRGRGESGDTQPYAVEREIEDLVALAEAAGGSAHVFGSSSGAVLALRAAAAGVPIRRLAVFEPPFLLDGAAGAVPSDLGERIAALVRDGRRADAVRAFMSKEVGVPGPMLLVMRLMPGLWSKLVGLAHTLPYDYAVLGDAASGAPLPAEPWSAVRTPTLVLDGSKTGARFRAATSALASVLPQPTHVTLPGQHHGAVEMSPKPVAGALAAFFAS